MVSRVLGLVRDSATAAVFGASGLMSAFLTGLTLPNLFRRLLAEGGLTAALVPTLNEQLERRQREGAFVFINQVASWLLIVTGAIVAAAMVLFSQRGLIAWLGELCRVEADTLGRWLSAARFAVLLFPYLLCVALAAAFSATLQSLHRFLEPALSPIWLNLAIIGSLAAAAFLAAGAPESQILWLTGGWLVGGLLQLGVPAWALMREGWKPRLDFTFSEPLRAMVRLMVPTLFSSSIYLVNMSASRVIGISLNDQAVSVINYAQRLMELPIGVFAVAVSTVVFPLISRYAAAGDRENLAGAYRKGMRLILLINIPAAAGLAALALPIIRVIFQHGRFGAEDTALMMPVLIANAAGLPFLSFASLALRAFYAQKDTTAPVHAALLSFAVNIGLSLALMGPLEEVGLAWASSVAAAAQAIYLQWQLARKHEGLAFRHLIADLIKITIAAGGMALAVGMAWWWWARAMPPTKSADMVGIAVLISLGIAVYAAAAWVLRVEGRQDALKLLGRFQRRRA